jgi:hypothetical protein
VLDQRLFGARLGHSHIVALVTIDQVWGRGRYQGRQDQYLDITIDEVLLGELARGTHARQLIKVDAESELPGTLRGRQMFLFLRWAPGEVPPYHHHLMPADEQLVGYVEAMIADAKRAGVLDSKGNARAGPRRTPRRR